MAGVGGRFALIFVFAIGVDIDSLAKPGVKAFLPGGQLLWRVVFEAKARVGEAGGEHVGGCLLLGFRQTKRGLVLAKKGVSFVGVPRWMAHFKSEKKSGRTKPKKIFEQRAIELEGGRKLDKDWAEMVAVVQYAGNFEKALHRVLAVAKALDVRDLLVGLQGEAEALGDALCPVQERRLGRHTIETMIDFDGGELLGVEAEHFAVRKLLRIEIALPLLIGVSRSADVKLACVRNGVPP